MGTRGTKAKSRGLTPAEQNIVRQLKDRLRKKPDHKRRGQIEGRIARFPVSTFRKRAKELGAVYKIARTPFIKSARVHEVIESLTAYPPNNIRLPSDRPKPPKFISEFALHRELLKRIAKSQKREREEREKRKRARQRETAKRRRERAKRRAKNGAASSTI